MEDTTKRQIRTVVLKLRKLLEREDLPAVLKQHGIFPDGRRIPLEKLAMLDDAGRARRARLEAVIEREVTATGGEPAAGVARYCREVTFTYLNRLVGLRCMEVRGLLDECIKTRADYAGRSLRHDRFRREQPEARYDPEDVDGLKAFLRAVFGELQRDIQILFDPEDEYSIVMPSLEALRLCIRSLNEDIPEDAFKEAELLGWVYQYFQSEEKNRVFEEVRTKKKKIEGDDIISATSLYTERYMVDYLVHNSLGAIWMEMYPDSKLCEGWPYFVKGQDLKPREPRPVRSLTFLDPACGSGHFLVVAFDLFAQMYQEEARLAVEGKVPHEWVVPKERIATTILEQNLYGIDIDLRSVQIAWLALYLKMREHQERVGAPKHLPEQTHLLAADATLLDTAEFRDWVNREFQDEPYFINILAGIAGRLKNLSEIGSLARPEEDLKELIRKERERLVGAWKKGQAVFDFLRTAEQKELPFDQVTDEQFWAGLMNRVTQTLDQFYRKAAERGDTRAQVLAHEASRGFAFLDLCRRRYDVVATNPPYMGSKNMGSTLKRYVEGAYPDGKRDLYAAFIQRCREWAADHGVTSMVSQHSWMFLHSFVKLRETVLRESSVQTLAHLGEHGFADSSAAGAFVALFTLANREPSAEHRLRAFRLIGPKSPGEKVELLREALSSSGPTIRSDPKQLGFLTIPESPLVYWLRDRLFQILQIYEPLKTLSPARQGLKPARQERYVRMLWEVQSKGNRWVPLVKGGGYKKWVGYDSYWLDWEYDGKALRTDPNARFQSSEYYFKSGITYSAACRGKLGFRVLSEGYVFDSASPSIFAAGSNTSLLKTLNCRLFSYYVRALSPKVVLTEGIVSILPIVSDSGGKNFPNYCVDLKTKLISFDLTERSFCSNPLEQEGGLTLVKRHTASAKLEETSSSLLHSSESVAEGQVFRLYQISGDDLTAITSETGTPAGWYPMIAGYDAIPEPPEGLPPVPEELETALEEHKRVSLSAKELTCIKDRLRTLYEASPGAKVEESEEEESISNGDEEEENNVALGARIPIPAETFLEELSLKMELHPITVYWLLEEMRKEEGLVCYPEAQRHVEDYFSVLILRILGHRWPKQIEANEPVPDWADQDGIIPITGNTGERTLLEQVRDRIAAEFGEKKVGEIEEEFVDILYKAACKEAEVKGKKPPKKKLTLALWLENEFFKHHVSQFKKRPIAWHLTSSDGTFQILLYYHKLNADTLRNVKNRYLAKVRSYYETFLDRARKGDPNTGGPSTALRTGLTVGELSDIVKELDEFGAALDRIMALPYEPIIDDGIRVNIAPLRKVRVLAAPVLAAKDVEPAIADRNRWRKDDGLQETIWEI